MIKSNEVRLGNWVKFDNRYFQIHSIADVFPTLNTDEFGIGVVDYNNIKPVELTPEILEAAGFSKRNNGTSIDYHIGINEVTKDWLFYLVWIDGFEYPFYRNGRHQIKYLHQLQNLFWCLCGQELQIDVNKLNK